MRGFSMQNDRINELKQNKLLEIFCDLVQTPSPSLAEDKVIDWISSFCKTNGITCELDDYKNVHIKVEATNHKKQPVLLSSHMDVVGDSSPINLQLDGDLLQTDKTRTLGADDKVGVSCALYLAYELNKNTTLDHGGLEVIFTRDEEHGMSGIKHIDSKKINSKYIFVLDADKLGQLQVSGAGYTNAILKVTTPFGGHSGIDIHEKHRLNAAKLIAELITKIPQGVFYADETGTITSINLGTIIAGNIQNTAAKIVEDKIQSKNYLDYFIENAVTNVINTDAQASYSIRSASDEKENALKRIIDNEVEEFNKKYDKYATAEVIFSEHLPRFEKAPGELIEELFAKAAAKVGVKPEISSFHAGAETHIYANQQNAQGEKFSPYLLGLADVFNMHSPSEQVNYKTLLKGYELIKQLFVEFNSVS